jgi:hypothetical protein
MPIQVKRSGVWSTPTAGSIRIKSGGEWKTAVSVRMDSGNVWQDSGYVSYPSPPTSFRLSGSAGNGDSRNITFTWNTPTAAPAPTGYDLLVYDTNGTSLLATVSTSTTSASYNFPAVSQSSSSPKTYYVRVRSKFTSGATTLYSQDASGNPLYGTNSSGGTRLKVDIGKVSYQVQDPSYWGAERRIGLSFDGGQSNVVYNNGVSWGGYAFDGNTGNYWSGSSWTYRGGEDWVSFRVGAGWDSGANRKKLVRVVWIPAYDPPAYYALDFELFGGWLMAGDAAGRGTFFGYQGVGPSSEFVITGDTRFRMRYSDLGENPTSYGAYRVMIHEIWMDIQDWITPAPRTIAAESNSVSNS